MRSSKSWRTHEDPHTPPPQPPQNSGADSGMEEPETNDQTKVVTMSGYESETDAEKQMAIREEVLCDSEDDISGIETVQSSSQEEETDTNPPNLREQTVETANEEKEVPIRPSLIPNRLNPTVILERCDAPETNDSESNNNVEKPRLVLGLNSHPVTGRTDRQIVIHQAPVRFPAGGNLMENPETERFITDALESVADPDDLPGDTVVFASLRNNMESRQRQREAKRKPTSLEHLKNIKKGMPSIDVNFDADRLTTI